MRYYGFSNYYLSQIQIGIQNAHCAVDLIYKYQAHPSNLYHKQLANTIQDWANNHKTMILLNGGNHSALDDLYGFFDDPRNPYPFHCFQEDKQSLNNATTCVGIILPEKIYEGAGFLRGRGNTVVKIGDDFGIYVQGDSSCDHLYSEWEILLMNKLNDYRLA